MTRMVIAADYLAMMARHAIIWHDKYPIRPGKALRGAKDKARTPFGVHPLWAALTILHEENLSASERSLGAQALMYHDILEDTTAQLPRCLSKRVKALVEAMTFESSDEEIRLTWEREPFVRLLKMYDKVSNWMDGAWMYPERRAIHRVHLAKLADDVEKNYGPLNIVRIARALLVAP